MSDPFNAPDPGNYLKDENGLPFGVKERNGVIVWMDRAVYEILEGNSYTVCDTVDADTTTVKWQIHTLADTGKIHLRFSLTCNGEALYLVTEGSDRDDGTALEEVNRNRVLPSLSETIVTRTPTGGTTDGATVLFSLRNGLLNKPGGVAIEGGDARADNLWILAADTKYVISVTTYAASYVTCKLDWFLE